MLRIYQTILLIILWTINFTTARAADISSIATSDVSTPVGSNTSGIIKWSDASSWVGGVVPGVGDTVTIPSNSVIVIDQNVVLEGLHIHGKLIVDLTQDIRITTEYVMVMGANAYFEWGTETEPYQHFGRIVLRGDDPNLRIPGTNMERKALVTMSGARMELHGKPKVSWTKLNATANIGDNTITVLDAVNWEVGDKIVIASTDYAPQNAEEVEITAINGTEITFTPNLSFKHFGKLLSYKNGTMDMDQRAEVGLLSRNLRIQGNLVSGTNAGFGAHVMVMVTSQAHVENVEFYRVGQRGRLGRYPFHWHIGGNIDGQYIKNSSIHESFNRGVVVHGSHRALVEGVVAYDVFGHTFFLEDGDEELNVFKNNLGIFTRKTTTQDALEPIEAKEPATYWITNPNNTFIDNVAAGSEGAGFWLIPLTEVLRDGAVPNGYSPREIPLLEFDGNVAHSNVQRGIMLEGDMRKSDREVIIRNRHPLLDIHGDTLKHVFKNFTAYKSRNCLWTRAGVHNSFINGRIGEGNFMAFLSFNAHVENTLFVGKNENSGNESYDKPGITVLGVQMYNGSTDFKNIHLADFDTPDEVCIGTRRSSGKYPNFTASGFTFENVPQSSRVNFKYQSEVEDPSRSYVYVSGMIDEDGSITGIPGGRLSPKITNTNLGNPIYQNRIYDETFNLPPDLSKSTLRSDWNAYITTDADYTILHNWAGWGDQSANEQNIFAYLMRSDGPAAFDTFRVGWDLQIPVIMNKDLVYYVQYHEIPNRIRSEFKWTYLKNGHIIVGYPNFPSSVEVNATKVNSFTALENATQSSYYFKDNMLYVHYVADVADADINTSINYFDYSDADLNIDAVPGQPNSGKTPFVTLADFEIGVDARATLSSSNGLSYSSISGNGSNPSDNINHSNSFSYTKSDDGVEGYVDYTLRFERQIWREFKSIHVEYNGQPVEVIVVDENNGTSSLGVYDALQSDKIRLDLNPESLDEVTGLILRFHECLATNSTSSIDIKGIYLDIRNQSSYNSPLSGTCFDNLSNDNIELQSIKVVPNPTSDMINIQGLESNSEWSLYNIQGELLQKGSNTTIDLKKYATGIYLLNIQGRVQKIIKQ